MTVAHDSSTSCTHMTVASLAAALTEGRLTVPLSVHCAVCSPQCAILHSFYRGLCSMPHGPMPGATSYLWEEPLLLADMAVAGLRGVGGGVLGGGPS